MAAVASNSVWEKVTWNGTKTKKAIKDLHIIETIFRTGVTMYPHFAESGIQGSIEKVITDKLRGATNLKGGSQFKSKAKKSRDAAAELPEPDTSFTGL